MFFKDSKWVITEGDYKLMIEHETKGQTTYDIYEMCLCPNEAIQKLRDDNSQKIILRTTNYNSKHPLAHPKVTGNSKKKKLLLNGKANNSVRSLVFDIFCSTPRIAKRVTIIILSKTKENTASGKNHKIENQNS